MRDPGLDGKARLRIAAGTRRCPFAPTQGPEFVSAIWAVTPEQRAAAEQSRAALERSGVFGPGRPVATAVLEGAPQFQPAPEEEQGAGLRDARALEEARRRSGRTRAHDEIWGLQSFCKDRVCGYVRFAKGCSGECLDVFPQYRDQEGTYAS